MEGEGAARAALDGAVAGALARRVASVEKVPHRSRGVEVQAAACKTAIFLTSLSVFIFQVAFSMNNILLLGGAVIWRSGFAKCFLKVTELFCSFPAAVPRRVRGTLRKLFTKPLLQVTALPSVR